MLAHCQPGEWMLDADQFTDTPTKQLVEDIIREKLYIYLHQELPYIIKQVLEGVIIVMGCIGVVRRMCTGRNMLMVASVFIRI